MFCRYLPTSLLSGEVWREAHVLGAHRFVTKGVVVKQNSSSNITSCPEDKVKEGEGEKPSHYFFFKEDGHFKFRQVKSVSLQPTPTAARHVPIGANSVRYAVSEIW